MTEPDRVTESFDHIPLYVGISGKHYWVIVACFHDTNPGSEVMMDIENLVSITPTGCAYCAIPWSPLNDKRRCPGTRDRTIRALIDRLS
jgi:hypothetical protein